MNWIDLKKQKPEDGQRCAYWFDNGTELGIVGIGFFDALTNSFSGAHAGQATHYIPIPNPPKFE